ncbi:MAG TPA: Hpt domain-containing protein, partial [Usitatibacter sp.]|nr:Hpt domain-containing protein [Usitatibacter sp.]
MPAPQVVQLVDAPGAQIDAELLEIFLEEATEVVETIAANVAVCRAARTDREALTTIRRGFHTLKGSGRMVGLDDLGEMAWQCEQVLNKWLKEEKPATDRLLDFVELARAAFAEWVGQLKQGSAVTVDASQIARRAEALKSDEPVDAAAAVPAAAVESAPVETAPAVAAPVEFAPLELSGAEAAPGELAPAEAAPLEDAPAEPVLTEASVEPLPFGEAAEPPMVEAREESGERADAAALASLEFTFESLDLAPPAEAPPHPAATESLDFAGLFDEPAANGTAALPEIPAEAPEAPAEPAAGQFDLNFTLEPAAAVAAPIEDEEIIVGGVSVPTALFAIYMGEAEEHAAAMDREMSALEADPMVPVSAAFMRAAHTLASSSRTTGFESIAAVSAALEKWLADAMDFPPEFDAHRLGVTRNAVDALMAMVQSVRGNAMPYPRDDVIESLAGLRESLRLARETGQGTHINMPGFLRAALDAAALVEHPAEHAEPMQALEAPVEAMPIDESPAEPLHAAEASVAAAPVEEAPAAPAGEMPVESAAAQPDGEKPFEAGKDQRRIVDDVDRDLLPIFIDEAKEIIPLVSEGVRRWRAAPTDHAPARDLQRHLHTLKGSARMTGLMRLGELAHVLEARVNAIDAVESPPARAFEEIEERVDRFSMSLERLARGEDIVEAEPVAVPAAEVFEEQRDKPASIAVIAAAAREMAQRDAGAPEQRESRAALLRVNAEMIDRFVNEAGELSIARSRIEGEMIAFKRAMVDLTENIGRMRTQLREVEIAAESQMQSTMKLKEEAGETFDPLELDRFSRMQELTRFLAESLGDVITLHQGLQKNLDEAELAIHAQARLNRDLQQGLMGVRLVPLGNLSDRFYRVVRQTAKELDKKANLELKGTRTELDRSVLEKITAPFEHLLRNAIAHGIEAPRERLAAGKSEIGEIALDAVQRGNEVVLSVSDDGGGLDFRRIREKAVEAGLLAPDVELPEAQLAQFIFMPGFSTASEVSQVAGRGVGMDVVRNEITSLGGRIEIASTPGRGTIFTITLPLTLAVTQAVMLRAGHTTYAIPSVMIEQVHEYKAQQYAEIAARAQVEWKGNVYPMRSLLPLLGEVDTPTPARQIPVLLLKSGLQRAAIRVDEIIGNREIVVKTIGPQLARLSGIAGATVLGNGQVVLILNPVQLVHREQPAFERIHDVPVPARVEPERAVEEKSGNPLVMVVDDSLTVRKITSRMLAREGFEVATAKDGVDALQQLQDIRPDCILLDVEMPRMDGFEFARNVRADEGTKSIPIIMITSRTADKHRNRALEIGVNEYMGKPYQEDQLLELIRRYTAQAAFA